LILPVVICLFQRLSHACFSLSCVKRKPRMAHYNSYNIIDDLYHMDTYGNSRANTCIQTFLLDGLWVFESKSSWGYPLLLKQSTTSDRTIRQTTCLINFCPISFRR